MPVYDFTCPKCKKNFTRIITLQEHERGPKCPSCGKKLEQRVSSFFAVTTRKS